MFWTFLALKYKIKVYSYDSILKTGTLNPRKLQECEKFALQKFN